ncbi:MAG: CRTAC1 family protein [Bryobacteraceae bacterium]|nr:CRTAC1 family protein [Bryobacteraceae bacterium]
MSRACAVAAIAALLTASSVAAESPIRFREVAAAAGIDFAVEHHPTDRKHLIETMAGGVAVFDYDGDGLLDIFFTNGAESPALVKSSPKYRNRLYRNLGGMKFQEVTENAGLAGAGFSTAAAAADYDNDGNIDLFVGGVRQNFLYRNRGDGTFEDVTAEAGIQSGRWCEGAAWIDYDNDGLLDLFVVNYLQWKPEFDLYCGDPVSKVRAYCHPRFFDGWPNTLYRNRDGHTFEDVSERSGISAHVGKGMSVAIADYDLDGYIDIFVTNDKMPNFLFHNTGKGAFEEVALTAGGALQDSGMEVSAMGADFRDYDNDGFPDIVFAALAGERFPLFHNEGGISFRDATYSSRLGALSHARSGWSIGLFDLDNDGWKDIFTTNSHVNDTVSFFEASEYKLPNSVFAGGPGGTFRDASAESGVGAGPPQAHRGCAFGDFNNDGRVDVVVVSLGGPAELWENATPAENGWLDVRLTGAKSNRDGIGARVRLGSQHNHMTSSVGYISSSHGPVHFGTGKERNGMTVEIHWPSGIVQKIGNIEANRVLRVTESE